MPRRPLPYLLALLTAVTGLMALVPVPATGAPDNHVDYVIVAGAAGLRWDDVTPTGTPTLWRLASQGSVGALSVRSAHTPTCPGDGWLTLGAGNFARRAGGQVVGACPPLAPRITNPDRIGAFLPEQQTLVRANRELSWGAQPGALAEAVRCSTAVGPGAAMAAARPYGRVDKYASVLPADPRGLLSSCVLSMVDLGTIAGAVPARRQAEAARADATLARILAARPERSLILVAGLSDTDPTSRLHVAIADGPGFAGGWLTSSTTGRPGYAQLIDLAPTALAMLGKQAPTKLFAGQPAARTSGRPADLSAAVRRLADADREAGAQRGVTGGFFGVLAAVELLLLAAALPLARRARSHGPIGPQPPPRWLLRALEAALVGASLAIPAAMVADAVPWWRSGRPGLVFTLVMLAILAVSTAALLVTRLRRDTLGLVGAVSLLAGMVIAVDVLTGARLQLNGVAGYSALEGDRYAGVGTVALGVFAAACLLGAGVLAQRVPRPWRPLLVAVVGGLGVLLVGSPYLGADVGGAVALTAGGCLAVAMATGGWLTFARVAWATLAGIAVTASFALLDLGRPERERSGLGRFLVEVRGGTSGLLLHRAGAANLTTTLNSPLTLLVIGTVIFGVVVMLRPWGGLKRVFGIYPAVKAGLVGLCVAGVIGGLFDGAGLNVAGAAAATALPLTVLASLRVLRHADDRTAVDGEPPLRQTDLIALRRARAALRRAGAKPVRRRLAPVGGPAAPPPGVAAGAAAPPPATAPTTAPTTGPAEPAPAPAETAIALDAPQPPPATSQPPPGDVLP